MNGVAPLYLNRPHAPLSLQTLGAVRRRLFPPCAGYDVAHAPFPPPEDRCGLWVPRLIALTGRLWHRRCTASGIARKSKVKCKSLSTQAALALPLAVWQPPPEAECTGSASVAAPCSVLPVARHRATGTAVPQLKTYTHTNLKARLT